MTDYETLSIAILHQAVKDYQTALQKKDAVMIQSLEWWFRSDWGQLLSCDMGELIISECRKRIEDGIRPNRLANKIEYRKRKDEKQCLMKN